MRRQAQQRLETLQAQRRKPSLPPPTAVPLGTYDGRIYRHNRTGVTFEVPEGWKVHGTGPSSDNGEMVRMSSVDPIASVSVWMIPEKNDWTSINEKLDASPAMKVTNRLEMGFFPGYRLRDGSVQRVLIGGKQAMVAIADYADHTDSSGRMAEYMTWIYTENTHTFFFARVEADKLEQLQPQLDALLSSAHIP